MKTNKTLYIADLDGTLLNNCGALSEHTAAVLNQLVETDACFSFATARTPTTALRIFGSIHLKTPVILMNGVAVYDPIGEVYIKKEQLPAQTVRQITGVIHEMNASGVFYGMDEGRLVAYYEQVGNDALQAFMDERREKYNKVFTKVCDFAAVAEGIVYIMLLDRTAVIEGLYQQTLPISGFNHAKYEDTYYRDNSFMELFSTSASKASAIHFLRERYGFDRVIGFGDNLNDIPLFEACDACYAVANAKDEIKEIASGVIGRNDEDGVANWLAENVL